MGTQGAMCGTVEDGNGDGNAQGQGRMPSIRVGGEARGEGAYSRVAALCPCNSFHVIANSGLGDPLDPAACALGPNCLPVRTPAFSADSWSTASETGTRDTQPSRCNI